MPKHEHNFWVPPAWVLWSCSGTWVYMLLCPSMSILTPKYVSAEVVNKKRINEIWSPTRNISVPICKPTGSVYMCYFNLINIIYYTKCLVAIIPSWTKQTNTSDKQSWLIRSFWVLVHFEFLTNGMRICQKSESQKHLKCNVHTGYDIQRNGNAHKNDWIKELTSLYQHPKSCFPH